MSTAIAAPPAVEVLARYLGPPLGRRGSRGSWWACCFHRDKNPSLTASELGYICFGCGSKGDSIAFVMEYLNCTFPEALAELGIEGGPRPRASPRRPPLPPPRKPAPPPISDEWRELAAGIVEGCAATLWGPRGEEALRYLREERLLKDETIRSASLGYNPDWLRLPEWLKKPGEERAPSLAPGITIPCRGAKGIELVNVRRHEGVDPKYVAMRKSQRGGIFPSPSAVKSGRPLVIVEGEFDALLLGQAIGDVASVITIGSASATPSIESRNRLVFAPVVFAAHDDDPAGDDAAARLNLPARRERPPGAKDWTDAARNGVDLRAWWAPLLGIADDRLAEGPGPLAPRDPAIAAAIPFMDEGEIEDFEERAAILEHDGDGMSREEAERHALRQVRPDLARKLDQHP